MQTDNHQQKKTTVLHALVPLMTSPHSLFQKNNQLLENSFRINNWSQIVPREH